MTSIVFGIVIITGRMSSQTIAAAFLQFAPSGEAARIRSCHRIVQGVGFRIVGVVGGPASVVGIVALCVLICTSNY